MLNEKYDIIIVGGGIVGLTLALALCKETPLSICVLERGENVSTWSQQTIHHRVSAITLASQRIFNKLKVWEGIAKKRISPFEKINVWNKDSDATLTFSHEEINTACLGYIVENNLIQDVLNQAIHAEKNIKIEYASTVEDLIEENSFIKLSTSGKTYHSRLVIAADGAQSAIRKKANIETECHAYDEQAIVATVNTEKNHERIARQIFLASGPLAFLPLSDGNQCSIVWSLPKQEAKQILQLTDNEFNERLESAFLNKLGKIEATTKRYHFPLYRQKVSNYVKNRIVLVGDAAHTVHPLAGQGVNMGLLDAVSLSDVIKQSVLNNKDFSDRLVLRRYERWRKADNAPLFIGIDSVKSFFANETTYAKSLLRQGLTLVDRTKAIKQIFIKHAVGYRSNLPTLAQ